MANPPRYLIGIDLGTTNCVLAYLETGSPGHQPRVLLLPQWDSPGSTLASPTLPSFNYLLTPPERLSGFHADSPELPVLAGDWVPGLYARSRMADTPGRVIHSAKSWLCHGGIDRSAAVLPWQSEDVPSKDRLSPVQASSAYLCYLKECWDRAHAGAGAEELFDRQAIVLTVPASFDEAAQQLTLEAARMAGYPESVSLLEEPQAAFYDWLGEPRHLRELHRLLEEGPLRTARVLVCDIGGGTTDFSLFEVAGSPQSPTGLALRRVAVSDHLLLGGDNIDLALAYLFEGKLTGGREKLSGGQWNQLLVQARELKERVLLTAGDDAPGQVGQATEGSGPDPAGAGRRTSPSTVGNPGADFTLTLASAGAGLFATTLSASISASELRDTVLEGFFPFCEAGERPRKTGSGLREWGLPYAQDTAVTRHLAGFLEGRRVDAVLFNGGSVTPILLRRRLTDLLTGWQGGAAPAVLENDAMALSVARGAARYAHLLQAPGAGERITGGHARALYLEVVHGREKKVPSLVCVLPKGMEANRTVRIENAHFDLLVNQSVRFQCFFSNRRLHDPAGEVVAWREGEFLPLPPLQTAIRLPADRPRPANNRLRVTLECALNELGLLQLYCVEQHGPGRWRLDFNLRRPVGEDEPSGQPSQQVPPQKEQSEAAGLILSLYGKKRDPGLPEARPRQLMRQLEKTLGGAREGWDSATLRGLWPAIAQGLTRRSRSVDHEEAWLYLAGFALRPGYGFALDDARIEELWRLFELGLAFPGEKRVQVQWWLLWRRTAGGLIAERQGKILDRILPKLQAQPDTSEILYLAGSLERIATDRKLQVVKLLTAGLVKPQVTDKIPYAWALGRLLARVPLYAGPEVVLPPPEVDNLFSRVRELDWRTPQYAPLNPLFAQAARKTEVRGIDLSPEMLREILRKMQDSGARPEELQVVREMVPVKDADRVRQFGESLPSGLVLVHVDPR